MTSERLEREVEALTRLDLAGLREAWRSRFGLPPLLRSPDLLRAALAWRMQAEALGGLDAATRRAMRRPPRIRPEPPRPATGTRLAREWKGERHEVEVQADGIHYRGQRYASLSEVARTITGARWNGPRFFGLRPGEAAQ